MQVLGKLGGTNRALRQASPAALARPAGAARLDAARLRELKLCDDAACPGADVHTTHANLPAGGRRRPRLAPHAPQAKARGAWAGHQGQPPLIEGTLIKLTVDHLPHDRDPGRSCRGYPPRTRLPQEVNRCWQAFLRRFDIERRSRFWKQVFGSC